MKGRGIRRSGRVPKLSDRAEERLLGWRGSIGQRHPKEIVRQIHLDSGHALQPFQGLLYGLGSGHSGLPAFAALHALDLDD